MSTVETQQQTPDAGTETPPTLTVTDNRTGTTYELPISDGTVRAMTSGRSRPARMTSG